MMKKLWIGLVLVLLLALLCCGAAMADGSGSCGNTVTWVLSGNTLTISGTGVMADYNNEFDNVPWFDQKEDITTVVINNGVSSIGDCAFLNCTGLTSVTIPGSVTSIGFSAFEGCSALNVVEIPNGVTEIASYAFYGCSCLTGVKIPESVTNIAYRAFASCPALKIAVIRNRETVIGDSSHDVFQDSDSSFILYGWTGSTAETYATDTGIGFEHLDNCSGQCGDEVYWEFDPIASRMEITGSGPMWDYSLLGVSLSNKSFVSAVIGSGVTSIGKFAFSECTDLTSVTIPNSVTSIGEFAFYRCTSLTIVTIPDSVTNIGMGAFDECTSLTNITIPDSVTSIGIGAFSECSNLTNITIPDSVTSIGEGAFYYCERLTNIHVTSGNPAFSSLDGVLYNKQKTEIITFPAGRTGSFTIPGSVTSVGTGAFHFSCLSSITIPNNVTSIKDEAFAYCSFLTSITIPNSVTSIGAETFYNCYSLVNITIPNSVTSIGDSAFSLCDGLTGITILDSVSSIGAEAFYGCTNLTSVTIPNSVTSIGKGAFWNCTNLKSVTVRNPYTTIGDSDYNVFYKTASGFTLHGYSGSTAETYAAAAGHTFKAITAEMATPSFTFPASLTAIEDEAFYGGHMTVVYIPDTVTSLGSRAFANCTSLLQIRIPAGITVIPADVFQGINKLQFIIFGTPGSAAETFANENGIRFEVD